MNEEKQKKAVVIALAGNPNSGKTTFFNRVTGASARVGNWPGVTVEKKEGVVKGGAKLLDLPGIYTLFGVSSEEKIARDYLLTSSPDVILNVVDALNLERNLYLTTQLLELGIPVVVALNMADLFEKRGLKIDADALSKALSAPCVEVSAASGHGCATAVKEAIKAAAPRVPQKAPQIFSGEAKTAVDKISEITALPYSAAARIFSGNNTCAGSLTQSQNAEISRVIAECEKSMGDTAASITASARYAFIRDAVKGAVIRDNKVKKPVSDKIDSVLTNRVFALPIFAAIMFLVYFLSIQTVGGFLTDWVNDSLFGEIIPPALENALDSAGTSPWLSSLLLNGIVAGVGAVLGFLPQMFVLFLCLSFLEDCGYMARVAFIMDRVFRRFGLSGKSFIPMLISTGCGVPAIMSSRAVDGEANRRITVIAATFIPCSAKLPVIALISGAVFAGSPWVAPAVYFAGIASVMVTGIILKKFKTFSGKGAPFIMELPAYHMPKAFGVLKTSLDRSAAFVKKAGTIILLSCVTVWFLSSFNSSLEMTDINSSMLSVLGGIIAPLFAPLGWGFWEPAVATVTGLVAKENVVSTFGVLMGFSEVAENGVEIWGALAASFAPAAAFSFLLFNLLSAPCFAAIGAAHRELGSAKLTLFAIAYQCVFAYAVSFMFYQFALLFGGAAVTINTLCAFLVLLVFLYLLLRKPASRLTGHRVPDIA